MRIEDPVCKETVWLGSSRKDLIQLGDDLCDAFGTDLLAIQYGMTPKTVKHLRDGISEIKISDSDSTYRLMYVAKFEEAVYVLHVFTKKSHRDNETPKRDADIIQSRHSGALELHRQYVTQMKQEQK